MAFADPSGRGTWMPWGGYAPVWGEPGTREPDTSDGPLGMADAYYNWGRSIDEVTYDESTKLVKEVKASQAYASYKTLYMESPAEMAGLVPLAISFDTDNHSSLPMFSVWNFDLRRKNGITFGRSLGNSAAKRVSIAARV